MKKFYYDDVKVTYEDIVSPLRKTNDNIEKKSDDLAIKKMIQIMNDASKGMPYIYDYSFERNNENVCALSYFYGSTFTVDYSFKYIDYYSDKERHYFDAGEEVTEYSDGSVERKTITDYFELKFVIVDENKERHKTLYGSMLVSKKYERIDNVNEYFDCARFLYNYKFEIENEGKTTNLAKQCNTAIVLSIFSFIFALASIFSIFTFHYISESSVAPDFIRTIGLVSIVVFPVLLIIFQISYFTIAFEVNRKSYKEKRFLLLCIFSIIHILLLISLLIYSLTFTTDELTFFASFALAGITLVLFIIIFVAINKNSLGYIVDFDNRMEKFNKNGGMKKAIECYDKLNEKFCLSRKD